MFIIKIANLTLLIDGGSSCNMSRSCNSSSSSTSSRFLKVLWASLVAVAVLLSAAGSVPVLFSVVCSVAVLPYFLRKQIRGAQVQVLFGRTQLKMLAAEAQEAK